MSSSLIIDEIHMCSISRFDVFRVSQEGEFCIFFVLFDRFFSISFDGFYSKKHSSRL